MVLPLPGEHSLEHPLRRRDPARMQQARRVDGGAGSK